MKDFLHILSLRDFEELIWANKFQTAGASEQQRAKPIVASGCNSSSGSEVETNVELSERPRPVRYA